MQVIDIDRLRGDVIVTFEGGLTVLYTAELLFKMVPEAQILPPLDPELGD